MAVAFPKWCTDSVVWLLHGWCHVKLPPSWRKFCVTIQPFNSLQCHCVQSRISRMHVCLAVTRHLHFWQNDRDFLRASAVTRGGGGRGEGGTDTEIKASSCRDSNPRPFDHESGALTTK